MNWNYIKNILRNLLEQFTDLFTAHGFIGKAAVGLFMYFAGVHFYIFSIIIVSLLDVVTGLWAAKKNGEEITSRKLKRGILEKIGLYLILMTAAFFLGKVLQSVLHNQTYYIAWLLTILINVYEITSIIENTIKIYPNLAFLRKLSNILNKVADKKLDEAEEKL